MDEIKSALEFLLGGVVIPCIILFLLVTFSVFNIRDRNYYYASGLILIAIGCLAYIFTPFGKYLIEHPALSVAWLIGYIVIGLGVSVGKWIYVVRDSKERLQRIRTDFKAYSETKDNTEGLTIESYIRDRSTTFTIKHFEGQDHIVVDTDKQPIPEWIMFWPFTLLSYAFEPLWSLVTTAAKRMGRLYDTISVKMLKM